MRTLAIVFLLLLTWTVFSAIEECDVMPPKERDNCYLAKSRLPNDCGHIVDFGMKDRCFTAIAEERAGSTLDCDRLYQQYQPLCYARLTYQSGKSQMACDDLLQEYKETCYIYYADHRSSGNITSCETIPPQYEKTCFIYFFKKLGVKSEKDCHAPQLEKYYASCNEYVGTVINPISFTLSLVVSFWNFISSGSTIFWGAIIVIAIIGFYLMNVIFRAIRKSDVE